MIQPDSRPDAPRRPVAPPAHPAGPGHTCRRGEVDTDCAKCAEDDQPTAAAPEPPREIETCGRRIVRGGVFRGTCGEPFGHDSPNQSAYWPCKLGVVPPIPGEGGATTCPNPHCENGRIRGTPVGCAACKRGERCTVCRVHLAGTACLRADCPCASEDAPVGKHGPYGTRTHIDGSPLGDFPSRAGGDAPEPASDDDLAYLRRVLAARPEAVCEHGLGASTSLARVWSTVESVLALVASLTADRDALRRQLLEQNTE